ncbi:MAG: hypothetical protein BWK79_06755 [Beggiatoa sp. IS2]|nr:MAG: hypothetical protein BWK79_06755 [Beggiatoa sp. IS2]
MSEPNVDYIIAALRMPPHSIEAEQSVLGGLMINPAAWIEIADALAATDFYRKDHQLIFNAIKSLAEEGHPSDIVTLSEWLQRRDQLAAAGNLTYLGQLVRNTPSAANIVTYATIVRQRSILRQLARVGAEITESAVATQGRSVTELVDHAEKLVFGIAEQGLRGRGGFVDIKDILAATLNRIDTLFNTAGAITGISSGFTDFDNLTCGLQRSDLIIIAGRPSMGKCLAGDSEVVLADGSVVTLVEIYRQKRVNILTLGNNWQFHLTQPCHFVDDGIKPVFRVTTKLGRVLETTITHPYLTMEGWKPLGELTVKTPIAVPRVINIFGQQKLTEHEFKQLNLVGKNAHQKIIPEIIFKLTRPQVAQFLNRLFAKDGRANILTSGQCSLGYTTTSEKLARQIQHLLLRFGIIARLKKRQFAWQLDIRDTQSILAFMNEMSIFGQETTLDKIKELLTKKRYQANTDLVPVAIWQYLAVIKDQEHWKDLARKSGIRGYSYQQVGKRALSRVKLSLLADTLNDFKLQQFAESAIYWDEIVNIEYVGEKHVYDLTVPQTHNFVANDICVHNTSFAMNIAEYVAIEQKLPVAVFSMEMSNEQLGMRLISSLARVNLQSVRTGKLTDDDWPKITQAIGVLHETALFIDDTPALSPTDLRARVRRLAREQGLLGLVVVDYLQLMQVPDSRENRNNEVAEISRSLKSLAKELSIPIIAVSQLNRSLEQRPNKRPHMADLRESGEIEQTADLVAFVYRDEVYNPDTPDKGTAEIIIAKQRNGPIDTIRLTFRGQFTKFENYTKDFYHL